MQPYNQYLEIALNSIRKEGSTLGRTIHALQRSLPAFDFYALKPQKLTRQQYVRTYHPRIDRFNQEYGKLLKKCDNLIMEAKQASWNGNLVFAIAIYQALIEEEYPFFKPYEMLISLHQKEKDKTRELAELVRAFSFFSELKRQQIHYVLALADSQNLAPSVRRQIEAGQKITYYANAFTLYDPAFVLGHWEKRIDLLISQSI